MKPDPPARWPKAPPPLSLQQEQAREKIMLLWHQSLAGKYGFMERFSQGWVAGLPLKPGGKTLEIGAGIGGHLGYEDLEAQDYHCLEMRPEFCQELKKRLPEGRVWRGDIQKRQPWEDKAFDRVLAVHVLEHLRDLPAALAEINRMLKDDGVFDVVLPCEGSLAYGLGRKLTAERMFKREFKMDYTPIIRNEHVSTLEEVLEELEAFFTVDRRRFLPLPWLPFRFCNIVLGLRLKKKPL